MGTFAPTVLLEAGGRWDLLERRYAEEPPRERANLDVQGRSWRWSSSAPPSWPASARRRRATTARPVQLWRAPRREDLDPPGAAPGGVPGQPGLLTAAVSTSHVERMTDIDRNVRRMLPASGGATAPGRSTPSPSEWLG